ncbi:hypothetical protein H1230_27210 [Paenibacillus sp. 19GGS1-52]|uniref:hypothetical protein n=1 Tax=Paenibacillus sp. 19GGS1-52 TaxID=2758563 RepID=UPI001EFA8BA0|nr:hypothetical protein [Paenibacillus sp. 19GGS1-52]ULO06640.1 hypothetical protein H1230_27210 [Paenibacillus sp. 19GGS1-52]
MEQRLNIWSDVLKEQDIPAEVVDWESIIAVPEDEFDADSEKLDAEEMIGESPYMEEVQE